MTELSLRVGLLVALVALAGCAGSSDPGASPTATSTPTPGIESYPPGTSESGVEDPGRLLAAHNATVGGTGYVMDATLSDGETRWNVTYRSSPDRNRSLYDCAGACFVDDENSSWSYYREGENTFVQKQPEPGAPSQADYSVRSPAAAFPVSHNRTAAPFVAATLSGNETRRTDLVRKGNHTYVRYAINGTASNRTVNGTVLVREDGLISGFEMDAVGPDGDLFGIRVRVRLSPGLTVSTPEWKERAVDAATIESWEISGGYGGYGGGCGSNDGDPSYDEDNDRDNDGICDEG